MKTNFTKSIFGILAVICLLLSSNLIFAQATWLSSGNFTALNTSTYNETVKVTTTGGSVGGGNTVRGYAVNGTGDILDPAGYGGIPNAFNIVPTAQLFKATAGKPFTITLEFDLENTAFGSTESTITMLQSGLGKNDQNYAYDQYITIPQTGVTTANNRRKYTFTGTYTFPVGRTQSWLVFGFKRTFGGTNSSNFIDNIIVLPFVVEGAYNVISSANPVQIKGYFKEPAIPQMILHNPPGDMSSVTFQTAQEACRNMSQSLTTEESNTGKLNVTLGIAGSAGLFVTTNFEFSVTASVSGGGGSTAMRSNGQQNCVSILNAISTIPGSAPVNQGSIYLGYSSDIAYGVFPSVIINTSPTLTIEKDSSLIFGVVPNSATPFYYSKSNILADIAQRQTIIDNPATLPKIRYEAQSQINIWRQVLAKDSININNPNAEVITPSFTLTGNSASISNSVTQSVSTTETYDVSHFLELGAGVSFVVKVGGSGVDGGYEFKTKKTMGTSVSNSNNSSTTIAYTLQDGDQGDIFRVKIIKDKTYGTPIFLLDSAQSKTSWPYEGGYPRDQPSLRFNAAPTSSSYTVPNVPVGSQSIFGINICNNSNEQRTYNLRFNPQSNANGANIAISGTSGNTEFGAFTLNANACHPNTFFASITQANAAALSSPDLNLQLYAFNDQARASDIFATSNWGDYALPSGISTGQTSICQGSNTSVPLTANCGSGSVATWYNSSDTGVSIGTGSPFSQSPSTNTNYYVSCNSGIYNYKKFPAKSVIVNPSPAAPIITESGPLSFCGPGSVTLKSYSANDNKVLNFVKTSSQYVVVPHNSSLNLSTTFTMEAWVNYSGLNSTIVDKGNYNFLWQLSANGNANKMGYFERSTGWKYSTALVPENTWTHVAITLQNGTLTFYINGVPSGTAAVVSAFQDNQPMNIGRQQPTACVCNHFNGSMDELRLWNVAKSQAEIQASMNIGVAANSAGLVAYYKFNDASGNTVYDATSNNNNGFTVNNPTRQTLLTTPFNEVNALWTPINTTISSITATTSGTYTATLTNSFGCSNAASRVVSVGSNAALVSLSSPTDDFSTGNVLRTASSVNGKITATNKVTGLAKVDYQAKSIVLNAGFKADSGTVFSATVGGCN